MVASRSINIAGLPPTAQGRDGLRIIFDLVVGIGWGGRTCTRKTNCQLGSRCCVFRPEFLARVRTAIYVRSKDRLRGVLFDQYLSRRLCYASRVGILSQEIWPFLRFEVLIICFCVSYICTLAFLSIPLYSARDTSVLHRFNSEVHI